MGAFRDWWNGTSNVPPASTGVQRGIISPYQDSSTLSTIAFADYFGVDAAASVTRSDALTVPGVVKARGVLVSLIADKPLTAYRGDVELPDQPTFLYRTNNNVSPFHRMLYTLDDLIFHGGSLWVVERGEANQITNAAHVPKARWLTDPKGRILVDDKTVDDSEVLYFPGPGEGLLTHAGRTLRGAVAIEKAWVGRVESPIPAMELHQTSPDSNLTDAEAKELVKAWAAARKDVNGAIGFTPYDVELKTHGQSEADLFDKGRNAIRLDIANFFNLPAALLDGSLSTATLTYSTQEGKRNEVIDYCLPYWIRGIEGRLSLDDVVPAGQRVAFDFSSLTTDQTGNAPETKD